MTLFADVDLASLPKPDVIAVIDYDTVRSELIADYLRRYPDYSAETLESDPVIKLIEVAAYRETILRQRVNDVARARMLPWAKGSDLDVLAADAGVYRLTLDPGDPDATPPRAPVYEGDPSLRRRTQLAPESLTTAGSEGAYIYHALTASATPVGITVTSPQAGRVTLTYTFNPSSLGAKIKDASAVRPRPGDVLVTVLGWDGDGAVLPETLAQVEAALSAKTVRPLCCDVAVQSAVIVPYTVTAVITTYDGLDGDAIKAAAGAALRSVAITRHRIGEAVTRSVIDAALHVAGVQRVTLQGWTDVICDQTQAPWLTGLTLAVEVAAVEVAAVEVAT